MLFCSYAISFPHSGPHILINTGVMEPLGVENIPVNVENLEYPSVDKMVLEREDINLLERLVGSIGVLQLHYFAKNIL